MEPRTRHYKHALIGFGGANMLVAAYLVRHASTDPRDIIIIDPHFDGGDLRRRWGSVISNTTWSQFLGVLRDMHLELPPNTPAYLEDQPTPLHVLASTLQAAVEPHIRLATRIKAPLLAARKQGDAWELEVAKQKAKHTATTLHVAPGGVPIDLPFPKPEIPLHVALTPSLLPQYVSPGQIVAVFGSAHSSILVADNIVKAGGHVNMIFKRIPGASAEAFLFARDGAYDGVKQTAAVAADQILADGMGRRVYLVPVDDSVAVHTALEESSWAVYGVGFKPVPIRILDEAGAEIQLGLAQQQQPGHSNIYKWGIAYPSTTTIDGRTYVDVSLPAFAAHILAVRP